MKKAQLTKYSKKALVWLGQIAAMVVVFLLASAYQERDLLDESGKQQAPSFVLPLLESNGADTFSSEQLKGKTSIIYFFAPWCTVCRLSMPNLESIYQQGDINAIGIALDYQSREEVAGFTSKLDLSLPILLGNTNTGQNFKIKGYPTYYVLNADGKIIERSVGYSTKLGLQYRLSTQ